MGQKRKIPEKNHMTTHRICLTYDQSSAQTHSSEIDERFRAPNISSINHLATDLHIRFDEVTMCVTYYYKSTERLRVHNWAWGITKSINYSIINIFYFFFCNFLVLYMSKKTKVWIKIVLPINRLWKFLPIIGHEKWQRLSFDYNQSSGQR